MVYAFGVRGGSLFVGGSFVETADKAVTNLGNVAEYDLGANLKLRMDVVKGPTSNEFYAQITATNRGPRTAAQVKVVDVAPNGYGPVDVSSDVGACSIKKGKTTCMVDNLEDGASMKIRLTLRAKNQILPVTNCAEVSSSTYDPNPENKKACANIPPQ